MFNPRLIALIVVKQGLHVQSLGFGKYLPVGHPNESAREFDRWGIDEIALVMLDSPGSEARSVVSQVSSEVSVPITAAGGIRSVEDVRDYIACGADKVAINRALVETPDLITEAAGQFGAQCIVASMDVWREGDTLRRWDYWKRQATNVTALDWVRTCVARGVGEFFVNFPQRDGACLGMDIEAVAQIAEATSVPVVAVGGVGDTEHLAACYSGARPSGIAIGNRLAHFEQSVLLYKEALRRAGATIRYPVKAEYTGAVLDQRGSPLKRGEEYLNELLFQRIEAEVI